MCYVQGGGDGRYGEKNKINKEKKHHSGLSAHPDFSCLVGEKSI